MKASLSILFAFALLFGTGGVCQDKPTPVSLIQLIVNPERFDGKSVVVRGFFLAAGRTHDLASHYLFFHKEDAENNLGNSIVVVPSDQMTRDQEKIDRMYVQLIGTFHTVHAAGADSYTSTIRDVTSCIVWSDPSHPITLKLLDEKHK
jgi:hypothetical protein